VQVWVGEWVFSDCVVVARAEGQRLSMWETCPCIRTASRTTGLPNGESKNHDGYDGASETKREAVVSANIIVIDAVERERDGIVTGSA